MRLYFSLLILSIITLSILSCKTNTKTAESGECNLDGFLNAYIDSSVKPQDDFFLFSMGKWIKNNPVPAAERSWGIWSMVNEENYMRLKSINEEAASKKSDPGSNWQKIGDLWHTGMDIVSIDQQGLKPLQPELDKIAAISDIKSLVADVGHLQYIGVSPFFGEYIGQDEKNSEKMALHIGQGGIGLPDRDYYFDNDARTKNIRDGYVKHLEKMYVLLGDDENTAKKNAATVMRLETSLAEKSRKLEALRDPYKNYNKVDLAGLNRITSVMARIGARNGSDKAGSRISISDSYGTLTSTPVSWPFELNSAPHVPRSCTRAPRSVAGGSRVKNGIRPMTWPPSIATSRYRRLPFFDTRWTTPSTSTRWLSSCVEATRPNETGLARGRGARPSTLK